MADGLYGVLECSGNHHRFSGYRILVVLVSEGNPKCKSARESVSNSSPSSGLVC